MKNIALFYLLIFLVLINGLEANNEDWIRQNIEYTINTEFDKAIQQLEILEKEQPQNFKVHFYFAATLSSKMTHFENEKGVNKFYSHTKKAIDLLEKELADSSSNEPQKNAQLLFYLGSTYGYEAFLEGRTGQWHKSISNGLKSIRLLERAVDVDSTLYDAYIGIGTYKYWLYSRLKYVSWLPFIPDDREQGIELIKKAIQQDCPGKFMAMHQLIYILLDFKQGEKAIPYAEAVVREYPNSQFMWWAAAHVYYKLRIYDKAIANYKRLLQLIKADPKMNPIHGMKCNLKLAQLYFEQEQYEECLQYCKAISVLSGDLSLREKGREIFAEARDMEHECEAKIKNLD